MDYLQVGHDRTLISLARLTGSRLIFCSPNGIRTRVATLRGWCPWPLDDGAERRFPEGFRRCSGGRTRTLNNWTRTSRVADYTTPEWVENQISRPNAGLAKPSRGPLRALAVQEC